MSVVKFPMKQKPWLTPQDSFVDDALDFVSDSPYAADLVRQLQSCASPFIRAAIICVASSAEDVPFLVKIAEAAAIKKPEQP